MTSGYPGVSAIDSRKPTYRPIGTSSGVPVKVYNRVSAKAGSLIHESNSHAYARRP